MDGLSRPVFLGRLITAGFFTAGFFAGGFPVRKCSTAGPMAGFFLAAGFFAAATLAFGLAALLSAWHLAVRLACLAAARCVVLAPLAGRRVWLPGAFGAPWPGRGKGVFRQRDERQRCAVGSATPATEGPESVSPDRRRLGIRWRLGAAAALLWEGRVAFGFFLPGRRKRSGQRRKPDYW